MEACENGTMNITDNDSTDDSAGIAASVIASVRGKSQTQQMQSFRSMNDKDLNRISTNDAVPMIADATVISTKSFPESMIGPRQLSRNAGDCLDKKLSDETTVLWDRIIEFDDLTRRLQERNKTLEKTLKQACTVIGNFTAQQQMQQQEINQLRNQLLEQQKLPNTPALPAPVQMGATPQERIRQLETKNVLQQQQKKHQQLTATATATSAPARNSKRQMQQQHQEIDKLHKQLLERQQLSSTSTVSALVQQRIRQKETKSVLPQQQQQQQQQQQNALVTPAPSFAKPAQAHQPRPNLILKQLLESKSSNAIQQQTNYASKLQGKMKRGSHDEELTKKRLKIDASVPCMRSYSMPSSLFLPSEPAQKWTFLQTNQLGNEGNDSDCGNSTTSGDDEASLVI